MAGYLDDTGWAAVPAAFLGGVDRAHSDNAAKLSKSGSSTPRAWRSFGAEIHYVCISLRSDWSSSGCTGTPLARHLEHLDQAGDLVTKHMEKRSEIVLTTLP